MPSNRRQRVRAFFDSCPRIRRRASRSASSGSTPASLAASASPRNAYRRRGHRPWRVRPRHTTAARRGRSAADRRTPHVPIQGFRQTLAACARAGSAPSRIRLAVARGFGALGVLPNGRRLGNMARGLLAEHVRMTAHHLGGDALDHLRPRQTCSPAARLPRGARCWPGGHQARRQGRRGSPSSMASTTSAASSRTYLRSEACVCARSHGQPSGPRRVSKTSRRRVIDLSREASVGSARSVNGNSSGRSSTSCQLMERHLRARRWTSWPNSCAIVRRQRPSSAALRMPRTSAAIAGSGRHDPAAGPITAGPDACGPGSPITSTSTPTPDITSRTMAAPGSSSGP